MKAAAALFALAVVIAGPVLAAAADPTPFPADSTSQTVVQAWIDRYLPANGYVIGGWSANVVMLVSTADLQAKAYPEVTTQVLTEVIDAQAAQGAGWRASMALDVFACNRKQYRTLSTRLYARADRKGGFDQVSDNGTWQTPDDGSTMDTVERAACFYATHPPPPAPRPAPAPVKAPPVLRGPIG